MDTDSSSSEPEPQPDDQVDSLVEEYFSRRQAGEGLTAESFIADHPELAEKLRSVLEGLAFLNKMGVNSGEGGEGGEGPETPANESDLPTIEGYDLIEELGRGGMGVAYKAMQLSTKRVVALKVMLAGPFASSSARRRFEREIELAARLQHPNIVRVLEGGRVAQQQYYSMDHVDGIPLDRYLSTTQPDVQTVLRIFSCVCGAVEYAHEHGVIHRDLKPANVLVDDEGQPHILDFGLAKAVEQAEVEDSLVTRVSSPGQVMGTLPYLSPEQAAGETSEIDTRTDVYALGVMLYEALTGSLPFDITGRPSEVIQRIAEQPPTRPSSRSDRVDGELETIILKALEKEKSRRYQFASELREDLGRYLEGEPILARPPSSLYVLRKKLRKHRLAASIALVLLTVVIVALINWWNESRARQRELESARLQLVQLQRGIERGPEAAGRLLGTVQTLYTQYPELPEAALVCIHAQHRHPVTRENGIRLAERLVNGDPSNWSVRLLAAEIHNATGDARRAEILIGEAERIAPDTAESWYLRSFATFDSERALQCAEEAVTGEPSHEFAWWRLAYLRADADDFEGAMECTYRLEALSAMREFAISLRGRLLVRQKRFPEAIAVFRGLGGGDDLALTYRQMRDYTRAVEAYTESIERDTRGSPPWRYFQRATPLWILGRREEALADYRRARELLGAPGYGDVRSFLILRELGRDREAADVLKAALRDVDVEEHWLRQVLRCMAGEISPEALAAEAETRESGEQLCEAYYYAGEVCLLSDRREEARAFFQQCVQTGLEFDPDSVFGTPMNEYELARWRLESLFADAAATPPEKTE